MKTGKLSDTFIENAQKGMHGDGGGLYLSVAESGSKQWSLRVVIPSPEGGKGKLREFGLGGLASCSPQEARKKAAEWRKLAKQGIDPKSNNTQPVVQDVYFNMDAIELIAKILAIRSSDPELSAVEQTTYKSISESIANLSIFENPARKKGAGSNVVPWAPNKLRAA